MSETERSLVEQEWFHGVLPREEVVRLLRADGDYLVRETTRNHARQLVLSVCWGQHKHFIVQTTPEVSKYLYFKITSVAVQGLQDSNENPSVNSLVFEIIHMLFGD